MTLLHGIYYEDPGLCACGKGDCVVYLAYQNSQLPFPQPKIDSSKTSANMQIDYLIAKLIDIETKLDTVLDFIAEYEQVAKRGADLLNSPGGKVLGFLKGRG
jgi:hypothetical protein